MVTASDSLMIHSAPVQPPIETERPSPAQVVHAISVDVEDWPQSTLDQNLPITDRVVRNTHVLLDLFREHKVTGTFFILGLVAERYPGLVSDIASEGHELGSHGYSHKAVFEIGPRAFEEELRRSVGLLEDITCRRVRGYRAPDFSITEKSLWALDLIAARGLEYDSSIFPVKMRRYGIDSTPRRIHRLKNGLIEVPMSTVTWRGKRWPVAGGGYFRLYPYSLTRRAIRGLEAEGMPAIMYLHPYEIDPSELGEVPHAIPMKTRLTQGLNRKYIARRLARLFKQFRFGPIAEVLETEAVNLAGLRSSSQS